MHRWLLSCLVLLVLLSAPRAEGQPKAEKPASFASEYRALQVEYLKALKESDAIFDAAKTDEERQAVRSNFNKWRITFLSRVLEFAENNPKDEEAILALYRVLHADTYAEPRQVEKAVQLVLKDHVKSERLNNPPILWLIEDSPAAETLMRGVLKENPFRPIQALARLRLGQILKVQAKAGPPERAAKLVKEAEGVFERVVEEYADVAEITEKAWGELFELRHVAVGKALPDIKGKDSSDRELKLSDYRGKVVVVTFWADWCGPCMKMIPHERSLVKRMEGKPFALVGVNRNRSRESLKACEAENQITWRSFFDGTDGPICKLHNIKRMPTVYVLDATGTIRHIGLRGEALDRAVDELLSELDKRTNVEKK
jgi:thiol-disulfide isomerase/thioredoxin